MFLNYRSPSDPAIPFASSLVWLIWITYQSGMLDHWGERYKYFERYVLKGGGGGYIQVVVFMYMYNTV